MADAVFSDRQEIAMLLDLYSGNVDAILNDWNTIVNAHPIPAPYNEYDSGQIEAIFNNIDRDSLPWIHIQYGFVGLMLDDDPLFVDTTIAKSTGNIYTITQSLEGNHSFWISDDVYTDNEGQLTITIVKTGCNDENPTETTLEYTQNICHNDGLYTLSITGSDDIEDIVLGPVSYNENKILDKS